MHILRIWIKFFFILGIRISGHGHTLRKNLVTATMFRGSYGDRLELTNYKVNTVINKLIILLVCFVPSLSSYHEKATVPIYFEPILTRLGVADFQASGWFFNFFPVILLLVRSHQAKIIIVKRHIHGCNNATMVRVEPRSRDHDHDRRIKRRFNPLATLSTINNCFQSYIKDNLQNSSAANYALAPVWSG